MSIRQGLSTTAMMLAVMIRVVMMKIMKGGETWLKKGAVSGGDA